MAVRIRMKGHVGPDGTLALQVPTGLGETEVEVVVEVDPVQTTPPAIAPEDLGWPPEFFDETYGSCQDDPLVRLPQGAILARASLPTRSPSSIPWRGLSPMSLGSYSTPGAAPGSSRGRSWSAWVSAPSS
jgi:hypothetical protein